MLHLSFNVIRLQIYQFLKSSALVAEHRLHLGCACGLRNMTHIIFANSPQSYSISLNKILHIKNWITHQNFLCHLFKNAYLGW